MAKSVSNIPRADFLMGAMRSMGYTFESAIADIIDNSISAGAQNIYLGFPKEPTHQFVYILDDGCGLDKSSLFAAMRYGSSAYMSDRNKWDLGRFGLGLKSASLSQCKVLSVVSKHAGEVYSYRWDYDYIVREGEWFVIELENDEISDLPGFERLLETETGTLVVWQNFDTIEKSSGDVYTTLDGYKVSLDEYLSLIFHRFLNGDLGYKIDISINNFKLKGLDPFLEKNSKTNRRQEIQLAITDTQGKERYINVIPFILPFQRDLSKDDIRLLGGIENLRTKQGFYIYRNFRLIIWGTWFGLPRQELTKNARIRVDIPNTLDDIWNIDIKKQNAAIPKSIMNSLKNAIKNTMDMAVKVQTHRGRIAQVDDGHDYIWTRIEGRESKYFYKINRHSKIFQLLEGKVDDETMGWIEIVLEEIERNVPYQQIYIDTSHNSLDEEENEERLKDIENKALIVLRNILLISPSEDLRSVVDKLFNAEPFCKHLEMREIVYRNLVEICH